MRICFHTSHPRLRAAVASLAIACAIALPQHAAQAQAIVLSVNGDPITSVDIEQRMKLLRALRRPASREAAVESMVEDRIKSREASHFGINIQDNQIGEEVNTIAKQVRMPANVMLATITRSGVTDVHARNFFKAQFGFAILVRALNKGVEASEVAVRGEMARERSKGGITNYTIRQIVFTFNPGAPPAEMEASFRQAQALRTRFTSCDSGLPYAKSLPNVAVRAMMTRSSAQLSDGIKELLDKTPVGHLTEPTRSPNGIELVAVCNKSATGNDDELRKSVSDRLLDQHFAQQEVAKYKELRATAVLRRYQ